MHSKKFEKRHLSAETLSLLQVVELPKEEPEAALRLFADIPGMIPVVHTPATHIVMLRAPRIGFCSAGKLD